MIREYIEELHTGNEDKIVEYARNEAVQNLKKMGEMDIIIGSGRRKFFVEIYAMITKLKTFTRQEEEVKYIEWIPMEELFETIRQEKTRVMYDKRYEDIFQKVREMYKQYKQMEGQKEKTRSR